MMVSASSKIASVQIYFGFFVCCRLRLDRASMSGISAIVLGSAYSWSMAAAR